MRDITVADHIYVGTCYDRVVVVDVDDEGVSAVIAVDRVVVVVVVCMFCFVLYNIINVG